MTELPPDPPIPEWLQGDWPGPETVELRPRVALATYERLAAMAAARGLDVDDLAAELLGHLIEQQGAEG